MTIKSFYAFLKVPWLLKSHHYIVSWHNQDIRRAALPLCREAADIFCSPTLLGHVFLKHPTRKCRCCCVVVLHTYTHKIWVLIQICKKYWTSRGCSTRRSSCTATFHPSKNILVRRTRHAGHCWRCRDKVIKDLLLWTPSHRRSKWGRRNSTYIQQLCNDIGFSLEDLPGAMTIEMEDERGSERSIFTNTIEYHKWYQVLLCTTEITNLDKGIYFIKYNGCSLKLIFNLIFSIWVIKE